MSRRGVAVFGRGILGALLFTMMAPMAFAADATKPVLRPADTKLRVIGTAILSVHAETPNLVGFKDYEVIARNGFGCIIDGVPRDISWCRSALLMGLVRFISVRP